MDPSPQNPPTSGSKEKKRSIWYHLHFWIGWISAVPVALICLTGAVLGWEQEFFRWSHKELFQLEQTGTPLSVEQVVAAYGSANPSLQVNQLNPPESPSEAYSAWCTEISPDGNRNTRAFLNPYTGEVIARFQGASALSKLSIGLHRHLLMRKSGQQVTAVSSLVLAITGIIGLVLWWPMRGRTFVRAWKRGQALDWHNALGLVALLPLIVMAVTGFSLTWGRHVYPFMDKLQGKPSRVVVPVVSAPANGEKVSLDLLVANVRSSLPDREINTIHISRGKTSPHQFILGEHGSGLKIFIDPYTGKELLRSDGSETGPVGMYRSFVSKFHTLGPYGAFARVTWGFLSLVGTVLVVTGLWISVKRWRRPQRRTTES